MRALRVVVLVTLAAAAFAACGEQPATDASHPTAPTILSSTAALPGAYYPMSPGNRWAYDWTFTTQIVPEDGPADPPEVMQERIDVEQGDFRTYEGREYISETEHYSGDTGENRRFYRQDRAGRYLLDKQIEDKGKSANRPQLTSAMRGVAARIAGNSGADLRCVEEHLSRVARVRDMVRGLVAAPRGGVAPGEIQTLAYPLHPGASWVIRGGPYFAATVEAHEQFLGFSSWRVRIDNEFLDDDDSVHIWYSRCGEVGWRFHFSSMAYNPDGTPLGFLVSDEVTDIIELDIDRGGCKVDGGGQGGGNTRNYPMAVGNLWTYEVKSKLHQNGEPPIETTVILDDRQEEWVEVEGRTYIKQVLQPRGPAPWTSVTYMRQDRGGLYSLDPPGTSVGKKGSRPSLIGTLRAVFAGPEGGESTTLVYPLKTGTSWTIRDSQQLGLWTATVESRERLSLPAGEFASHRIRVRPPHHRPDDVLYVWYGPEGLLKAYQRVVTQLVDDLGNVIEETVIEEEWRLQSLELIN